MKCQEHNVMATHMCLDANRPLADNFVPSFRNIQEIPPFSDPAVVIVNRPIITIVIQNSGLRNPPNLKLFFFKLACFNVVVNIQEYDTIRWKNRHGHSPLGQRQGELE